VTDPEAALRDPELAVLSAMAHGHAPAEQVLPVALAALAAAAGYTDERALLSSDLVMAALSHAARIALEELMRTEGYQYQSDFARHHQALGRAEGEAKGEAKGEARAVITVLEARGLVVTDDDRERILAATDLAQLDRWLRRAVAISTTEELFAD
jgi:hypothetical protein